MTVRVQRLCPISNYSQARSPLPLLCQKEGKVQQSTQHLGFLKRKAPSITGFNPLNVLHKAEWLVGKVRVVAEFLQSKGRREERNHCVVTRL